MSNFLRIAKKRISNGWRRMKSWAIGILIALGLVAGVAMATEKNFNWTNPTQNTDGSVFTPATDQAETRIYCGEDPALFVPERPGQAQTLSPTAVVLGDATTVSSDFIVGTYTCFATVVSVFGYESDASSTVTFTITPTVAPAALTDFSVN